VTASSTSYPSRRAFIAGGTALAASSLAGCSVSAINIEPPRSKVFPTPPAPPPPAPVLSDYATMYAPVKDEGFDVPGVPWNKIDQQFLRQVVPNMTGEREGTMVVDTSTHHLYFTLPGGHALRYGVGLGRAGFEWSGLGIIKWKQKWPKWTPPAEMIKRDPKLEKWSEENGGQPGGLRNPLGARALYIFQDDVDTLFRVHGTPEWKSIGKSVSSGCVRMIHQDVMDLYEWVDRAPVRVPIVVVNGLGLPVANNSGPSSVPIDDGWPTEAEPVKPI